MRGARIGCVAYGDGPVLQGLRFRLRRNIALGRSQPQPFTTIGHVRIYNDFVFDASANGRQLKCPTVLDEYSRDCLAIDLASGIRSGGIEVLAALISAYDAPYYTPSDGGSEFVARAILCWISQDNMAIAYVHR